MRAGGAAGSWGVGSAGGILGSVASAMAVERVLAGWATQADRDKQRRAAAAAARIDYNPIRLNLQVRMLHAGSNSQGSRGLSSVDRIVDA
jgi:hypothetical protein